MKINKLTAILMTFLFVGLSFTNCDDNIPKYDDISVESIKIDDGFKGGKSLYIGETLEVAGIVSVTPIEATNKMETFFSSNTDVATVNAKGLITANTVGTAIITITVDGKSDQFELTVAEIPVIRVSEILIATPEIEMMVGISRNIATQITVLPQDAVNKNIIYESDDETTLKVDQNGIITALKVGTAKVTVISEDVPSIKEELNVTVKEFKGDYPSATWTMFASQTLFVGDGNSITGAFDGNDATIFALVRPSKSYGGVSIPSAASGGYIAFIVDMQKQQAVNYFRIRHRNTTQIFLRYMMIEEISGSNDNENFTTIATNVEVSGARTLTNIETDNVSIPESNYRYLKFYCQKDACFYSMSQGASAQLTEFYLGKE